MESNDKGTTYDSIVYQQMPTDISSLAKHNFQRVPLEGHGQDSTFNDIRRRKWKWIGHAFRKPHDDIT